MKKYFILCLIFLSIITYAQDAPAVTSEDSALNDENGDFVFVDKGEVIPEDKIVYTIRKIEVLGLDKKNRPRKIFDHLFELREGESMTGKKLKYLVKFSKTNLLSDPNYDFVDIFYDIDKKDIDIFINVGSSNFLWTFDAGEAYLRLGYRNLMGTESELYTYLGYNIQGLGLSFPYINGSVFGFDTEFTHSLIDNKYTPSKSTSALGGNYSFYGNITKNIKIGFLGETNYYIDRDLKQKSWDTSVGGFLDMDYVILKRLSPYRFHLNFKYERFLKSNTDVFKLYLKNILYYGKFKKGINKDMNIGYFGLDFDFSYESKENKYLHNRSRIRGSDQTGSHSLNLNFWSLFNYIHIKDILNFGLVLDSQLSWTGDSLRKDKKINPKDLIYSIGAGPSIEFPEYGGGLMFATVLSYYSMPSKSKSGFSFLLILKQNLQR